MSMFIEVDSVEKQCSIIINLDHIVEIAPLREGGCILYMTDGAGMNSRSGIRVNDNYMLFKQFALEPVTPEDIAKKFPKATPKAKKSDVASAQDLKFGVSFDDIPKL